MSRSSSYHQDDIPRSPVASRPQPPRSHSSASYLHKHRRSPSITKQDGAPPTSSTATDIAATDFAVRGSIRQSPPPITNLKIPSGAVISPPDSSENSDGDEGRSDRGRELEKNWHQLQQAVRALPQQREGSPNKDAAETPPQGASVPASQVTSPTALSAEARKISHSRSSTETKIMLRAPTFVESPIQVTDSSDDDENLMAKPALVRKKSGELVKPALRPSSRRRYSSMPGTPTYSKSVHFNDSNNQTRHFLQVDKPTAVSAGSSPVETYDSETEFPFEDDKQPELEIKIANFPELTYERRMKPVRLERLFLSGDKTTLVGVCAVQNIAFQKQVVARFTLDYWKTTSEVMAEYNNDVRQRPTDGCDRFNFHIKLTDQANIDNKTLLLCVRYNVGSQEFWDNNNNTNYQVDFTRGERKQTRPVKSVKSVKPVSSLGQRPLNAIPRSRHTSSSPRAKPDSLDDDFAVHFDNDTSYSFGSPDKFLGDSPASSIRLKPKSKRTPMFASQQSAPANGLGSRYDFGNSLSAALSVAHDKLGRQSGLTGGAPAPKQPTGGYFGPVERTGPAKVDTPDERPDAIVDDNRPAIGSDQYRDLVQKFCYFTPGSGKMPTSPQAVTPRSASTQDSQPAPKPAATTDGALETESGSTSTWSSGASSPVAQVDGVDEQPSQSAVIGNHFASRAASPAPATGQGYGARSASPVSFGYPYHSHRDGYLSDTPTPTAIHG